MLWWISQIVDLCVVIWLRWMRWRLAFGLVLLLPNSLKASVTQLEPGVFEVADWDWQNQSLLLEGQWRFFPMQLLAPNEARARMSEAYPLKIPGAWNRIPGKDGQPMGAHGYGTYVARVDGLPDLNTPLSLRLQYATSNYRLFWLRSADQDADIMIQAGHVGQSKDESMPQFLEKLQAVPSLPDSGPVWIVVHVSNYHWVEGGMFYAPELGLTERMDRAYYSRFIGTLLLSGMFIMLMLINLSVYLRQRDDKFALWLVLLSAIALLSTSTFFSQVYYFIFTPSLRAHQLFRYGQNAFGTLILTVFNQLVYLQYPRQAKRWIAWVMWSIAMLAQSVYAFSPFTMPIPVLRANQAVVLAFPFLVTWQVWLAWRAREENSGLSMLSFTFFFATLLNDLLIVFRVYTGPMLSSWGLLVIVFMQTQLLAIKFAQAFEKTRSMSRALTELNQSLEQRVALQTREIRSLLTHVKIGIFGLMGSSKKISKDYSQHLEILFEDTRLEGRHGLELLLTGTDLMQDKIDQIDQALNTCMGEAEINFQLNAHVLPTTLKRRDKQGQVHHYELTWDAVPNEEGLIAMILVTVNDVTELRKFESVAQRKSVELAMVGEILGIREDEFRRFLSDARDLLQHSRKLLQSSAQNQERLGLILIDVHTLKGSARTLHLSRLTEALHFLEKNYKGKPLDADAALRLQNDLDGALLILQDYEDVAIQKLKWDADESPMVKVKKELLEGGFLAIKRLLPNLSAEDAQACKPLCHLLQIVSEVPLEPLLKNLLQNTARVAADLGKPAPRLQVHVPMVSCNKAMEQLLRKILIHIVRNMMDHGIELPAERARQGKAANGLISIEAEAVADSIVLRIRDDGRGLDLNELARVHGGASDMSESMIADLIFKEGLSTARTVTDMSGHGLGMAAVRKFVEESGGTVEVVLEPERQGSRRTFHLCVHLPLTGFTNHSHSSGSAA